MNDTILKVNNDILSYYPDSCICSDNSKFVNDKLLKMNLNETILGDYISPTNTNMTTNSPIRRDSDSQYSDELDSSQELYSSGELYNDKDSSKWTKNIKSPHQNCKRCGIIFVETESVRDIDDTKIHFLVVRGKVSNIWSFAKGRLKDDNESEEECALREVYEETGIKIETIKGLPRIVIGRNVYFIMKTTRMMFSSFTIHDNYEIGEVAWKTAEELRRLISNKDIRAVLRYPQRIFPYHRIIYSPSVLRNKYSFGTGEYPESNYELIDVK